MLKTQVEKRFPANTLLEKDETNNIIKTFLNDSKADGELYALFLSLSVGEEGETRVYKDKLPSMAVITKDILRYKSRQTAYNKLKYLIENDYIKDEQTYYVLPRKENAYFSMSQDLLEFFVDVVKQPVIKLYIYLGQRDSYKKSTGDNSGYVFTIKEICEHLGMDYGYDKNRQSIKNYLIALEKFDLIETRSFREGQVPKIRLVKFNKMKPDNSIEV